MREELSGVTGRIMRLEPHVRLLVVTFGSREPVRDQIVAGIACRKCENSSRLCEHAAAATPRASSVRRTRLFRPAVVRILHLYPG
jgi:hypothetical protein